jgi:hypothetical protein
VAICRAILLVIFGVFTLNDAKVPQLNTATLFLVLCILIIIGHIDALLGACATLFVAIALSH